MKRLIAMCLVLALTLFAAAALAEGEPPQPDHEHVWVQGDVMKPTCTEDGYVERECSVCKIRERDVVPAGGHNWQYTGKTEPSTCVAAGWSEVECANCHEVQKLTLALAPHQWTVKSETKSTCAVKGVKTEECSVCQQQRTTESPLLPHIYGDWTVSRQATDHSAGQRERTCTVCGKKETESFYPEGTLMRGGQRGDKVQELQTKLVAMGFLNDVADGIFGKNTEQAVKRLQQAEGLSADGIAWPQTIEAANRRYQRTVVNGATAAPQPTAVVQPTAAPQATAVAQPTAAPQPVRTSPDIAILPRMSGSMSNGAGCAYWAEGIGIDYISCCRKHEALTGKLLNALGMKDKVQRGYVMKTTLKAWNEALDTVCADWAAWRPDVSAQIEAARDAFHASVEANAALFQDNPEDALKYRLYAAMLECTRLCAQLNSMK